MRHILRLNGTDHRAALALPPGQPRVLLDDTVLVAELSRGSGSAATLCMNAQSTRLHVVTSGDACFVWLDGEVYEVDVLEPMAVHARQAAAVSGLITHAPMPGSVVALPVHIGDVVSAGDTLVVIESMKLEVSLKATQAGRVVAIGCSVGGTFDKDAVLVRLAAMQAA